MAISGIPLTDEEQARSLVDAWERRSEVMGETHEHDTTEQQAYWEGKVDGAKVELQRIADMIEGNDG